MRRLCTTIATALALTTFSAMAEVQLAPESPSVAGKTETWSCDFPKAPSGEKQTLHIANRMLAVELPVQHIAVFDHVLIINNDEAFVGVTAGANIRPSPGIPNDLSPSAESDTILVNRLNGDAAVGFTGLYQDGPTYRGHCKLIPNPIQN